MADIRIMRTSGLTVPTGAQLFPGQLAVNEERLYVGLYNSLDEAAAPYAVAMLGKDNVFAGNISIDASLDRHFEVVKETGTYAGTVSIHSSYIEVSGGEYNGVKITQYSVVPGTTETGSVGESTLAWGDGYFKKLHLTGTIVDNTQAVTKEWVLAQFAANDVMVFKGTLGTGGTVTALPTTGYSAGWTYRVITAGTYAGKVCEVGDIIFCVKDYASGFLDSDWTVQQNNIDGAVVGPASTVSGRVAFFDGATGKLITSHSGLSYDSATSTLTATNHAGTWAGNTIAANKGGTGQSSYTVGDILYASAAAALSKLPAVAAGSALISNGTGTAPTWGKIGLTTHVSGTLGAGNGGTGQNGYTVGDILYASASTTLSKLADVAAGSVLISGGVGVAPAWGKVALGTHVSGTLGINNGGTGKTTIAIDAMWYASAANTLSEVATTTFGRSLLAAVSGTKFSNLYADRAYYADLVTTTADTATNQAFYIYFGNVSGGNSTTRVDTGFTYNPSTGKVSADEFDGLIDCGTWPAA